MKSRQDGRPATMGKSFPLGQIKTPEISLGGFYFDAKCKLLLYFSFADPPSARCARTRLFQRFLVTLFALVRMSAIWA